MSDKSSATDGLDRKIHNSRVFQRLAKYILANDWEGLHKEVGNLKLTPEEEKEIDRQAATKFHRLACQQARGSIGQNSFESLFRVAFLYNELSPRDGIEATLARVIPTLTETTMECVRRGSVAEALPIRDLEFNYATKMALVLAALTKAWDGHREHVASSKKKKVA
jgi:hypothetical protein